jgi:hypothetical protein
MTRRHTLVVSALIVSAALVAAFAFADAPKESKSDAAGGANKPEMKLPPGWTEADMQACMAAGTPGKMQEMLAKDAGTWIGKNTIWNGPGVEPLNADSTTVITPIMGGRYIKEMMKVDLTRKPA